VGNSYAIQYWDLLVATALAIEKTGEVNTASWTQAMYDVTGGEGEVVYTYEDGLAAIRAGKDINYDGVTGSMEYTATGVVSGIFGIFEWQNDGSITQIDTVDGDEVLALDSM
jgi:branched-chain amino acid transport system substrate-binding protein